MIMMNLLDLMHRYNVKTRQGMSQWVKSHLDEINADGTHASLVKGEWDFDVDAVHIMDKLRGFGKASVVKELENAKVAEAKQTAENYRLLLLQKQEEINQLQQKLLDAKDELLKMQPLALEAAQHTVEIEHLRAERDDLNTRITASEAVCAAQKAELTRLKEEQERLKNRGFWDRLFNK